jgi:hypothetical protein
MTFDPTTVTAEEAYGRALAEKATAASSTALQCLVLAYETIDALRKIVIAGDELRKHVYEPDCCCRVPMCARCNDWEAALDYDDVRGPT